VKWQASWTDYQKGPEDGGICNSARSWVSASDKSIVAMLGVRLVPLLLCWISWRSSAVLPGKIQGGGGPGKEGKIPSCGQNLPRMRPFLPAGPGRNGGCIEHQQHQLKHTMSRDYYLYTGDDGNSHVQRGSNAEGASRGRTPFISRKPRNIVFGLAQTIYPHMSYAGRRIGIYHRRRRGPLRIHPGQILCWRWTHRCWTKWQLINVSRGAGLRDLQKQAGIRNSLPDPA